MAILVADNFQYQGRKPLDSRLVCETIADMIGLAESIVYEGILVYNKETKKFYSFDPANEVDETTGKWREFETGGGSGNAVIAEYQQATEYKKDTLVYCGDRLGRVTEDFTSNITKLPLIDCFNSDIEEGFIVVDQINIAELDNQLLKALPIVAFVNKDDIPRFEADLTVAGDIPKFRDGSGLSVYERKGCNFLYITDNNEELIGLAIIRSYSEEDDEFIVNAMRFGAGTADSIIESNNVLTDKTIGGIQIVPKDALMSPVLDIKAVAPDNTNLIWFESTALDASEITPGEVNVKIYNTETLTWEEDTINVNNGDIVRNGNSAEWIYYGVFDDGNISIILQKYQVVYDTNGVIGKILDLDMVNHSVTIRTIHSGEIAEQVLKEDIQANTAIGAAAENTLYEKGITFTDFVKKIAIKDILANITFTATNTGLKQIGTTISDPVLTMTINNLGNVPIEKIEFYLGNAKLDTQIFIDGVSTYSFDYIGDITTNSTFSVRLYQEGGRTVQKEAKYTFVNPRYFGNVESVVPTEAEILALTQDLAENRSKNIIQSMTDSRTCYAYPASMGNLTSIKDSNNFEYLSSFTKTPMTINDDTYNVYVLTDPVTVTNFSWAFR